MNPWFVVLIVLLSVFVLCFAFAAVCYNAAFGKRYDKNPLLKYFTAEDFGLTAEAVPLYGGAICGYLYAKGEPVQDKTVIFCHGMGPGHCAYMTEIAYFCNNGFIVLAFDNRGCNLSSGGNIKGMYSGVETAVSAVKYARERFDGKVYLVGHSWGAYSALCASAEIKTDGVVAISSPDTPSTTLVEGAAHFLGKPVAVILKPFWYVINLLKFGIKGNASAAKSAKKNGTPTLLIHGECDKTVSMRTSAYTRADGERVTNLLAAGKAHNPYNTLNAEKKLAELSLNLMRSRKMTDDERKEYFGNFDFKAATEEDAEVMQAIADFLN